MIKGLHHNAYRCRDSEETRQFYEEFLGLEVVRHARPAMMLRLRSGMYVVCVCRREHLPEQHVLTHWGVYVASREEVERAHAEAHRLKDKYGIRKITKLKEQHGAYAFFLQDLDYNWWEIQHEPRTIDAFFAGGDRFDMTLEAFDNEGLQE